MSDKIKKIKFTSDAYYGGKLYASKGEVKEIDNSLGMADRWISRNVAGEVVEEEKAAPVKKKKASKKVVKKVLEPAIQEEAKKEEVDELSKKEEE